MKRSSPYFHMKYRVDCRFGGAAFFETIAVFNVDRAAFGYMEDCFKCNPHHAYRVMERRGLGWSEIKKPVKTGKETTTCDSTSQE